MNCSTQSDDPSAPCCPNFVSALESGSDNEGYGKLIHPVDGEWQMGCDLLSIAFCPWCGKVPVSPSILRTHRPNDPAHPHMDDNETSHDESEHRVLMEEHLRRALTKDEVVHHIDEDKTNNKIENLERTNGCS